MKKPPLIIRNVMVFSITGAIASIWVPIEAFLHGFDLFEVLTAVVLFIYCGMSITAGYHRLWSHRTYQASTVVKIIYAIGGAFAMQNSVLHWASDHRFHHKHVDNNDNDPYSAGRGLWYSHIGWMLREYHAHRYDNYENCKDLLKDPVVVWQHKHYLSLTLATNIGVPVLLGWLNGDVLGMLLLAGVFRLVASHHTTFLINSAAHKFGSQPYTTKNSARDNGFLAFFTFGEGYHNFHHLFEADYRNGIRWWHFDPTKWLIQSLSRVGLVSNLRRYSDEKIEKAKLKNQLTKLTQLANQQSDAQPLLVRLNDEYDKLIAQLEAYYSLKKLLAEYRAVKHSTTAKYREVKQQYKAMKQCLVEQKSQWQRVNRELLLVS